MESLARDSTVVSLHLLLPEDMRRDLPSIDSGWQNFRGGPNLGGSEQRTTATAAQLEAEIQRQGPDQNRRAVVDRFTRSLGPSTAGRPTLSFSHLLLPHVPWQYLPDGSLYGQGERLVGASRRRSGCRRAAAESAYQRHLLQLGFLDRQLGKMIKQLRATGAYDDSLLVVTSDHGISFRAGQPRRVVNSANAQDLMPVPLIIKAPRQRRGRTIERHVQTIDVLPTIADLLDVDVPWRVDGRSALAPRSARTTLSATSFGSGAVTLSSAELERRRADALRLKLRLFGSGVDSPGLWGTGRRPALIGRPVAQFGRTAAVGARASIDYADRSPPSSPGSGFQPVHVTGEVQGERVGELVVGVNGRIAAVTEVVRGAGPAGFAAVFNPALLRKGGQPRRGSRALHGTFCLPFWRSLGRQAEGYSLRGTRSAGPGNRHISIENGAVAGFVDRRGATSDRSGERLGGAGRLVRARRSGARVRGRKAPLRRRAVRAASGHRSPERRGPRQPGIRLPGALDRDRPSPETRSVLRIKGGKATRLEWFCGSAEAQQVGC